MKKILTFAATITVAGLVLTGCASTEDNFTVVKSSNNREIAVDEFTATLEDGTKVNCIYAAQNIGGSIATGGPSCDWENATQ